MFRSRITFEQYLRSVEHEAAAGEDVSLDDIEVVNDVEDEEEVEIDEENALDSRVSVNFNPALVSIPEDFNDDEEVLIIDDRGNARKSRGRISVNTVHRLVPPERIMVPLNNLLQPIKKAGSLFNRFLSDVARRSNLCPLNYDDWRLVNPYFRGRIIMFIRRKFMLPDGVEVNRKVLSAVGEKVRGYRYTLRCKYMKEGTTKEALYDLESSKRPSLISDQMWVGLVDHFFSEKFQKFSKNGKRAREKQLHPHTNGSESMAIKKDKFETKHEREPGPLEWFVETHQSKDKSYHNPITKKFVDSAMSIIKKKTGCSEVVFSESTVPAETLAYRKLLGAESSGRVRGYGYGVAPSKVNGKRNRQNGIGATESSVISVLIKEVRSLRQEVADLKSKRGDAQSVDTEEDQRTYTSLNDGEHVRNTPQTMSTSETRNLDVLGDIGEMRYMSRLPPVVKQIHQQEKSGHGKENAQLNSIQGINKSSKSEMGKKRISITNETENSMKACGGTVSKGNTNVVGSSKQAKIATMLTHDQSQQSIDSIEHRRTNTRLDDGEHIRNTAGIMSTSVQMRNSSVLGDIGEMRHVLGLNPLVNQEHQQKRSAQGKENGKENAQRNSIQGIKKCSKSEIAKKRVSNTNEIENSMKGCGGTSSKGNTNVMDSSKQAKMATVPTHEQSEQSNRIEGVRKSPSLSSTPFALSRGPDRCGRNSPSVMNGHIAQHRQFVKTQDNFKQGNHSSYEGMHNMSAQTLTKTTNTEREIRSDVNTVARDGCHRLVGASYSQQAPDPTQKRKDGHTSNLRPNVGLPPGQLNQIQQKQKQFAVTNQLDRAEIETLVDKVLEENPEPVKNFRNPQRREFAHCYLGGLAMGECKRRADPEILNEILWDKLFATTK